MVQCGGEAGPQHRPGAIQEFMAANSEYTTGDSILVVVVFLQLQRMPISNAQKI